MTPAARRRTLAACAGLLFAVLVALGSWQVQRLGWKQDLIARVGQRVHAAPVAAPDPARWPQVNAAADEYRHLRVSGSYLYALSTRVQASTELGSGYWLLTPLRCADGSIVLVNRGFIPAAARNWRDADPDSSHVAGGTSSVTGLLRMSEPGGGFLRHNDPAGERWYSRDVAALAAARGLSRVAPYFLDADAAAEPANAAPADPQSSRPVAGLTVIRFPNNHLVYALTWYALALMLAAACLGIVRNQRKREDGGKN